MGGAPRAPCGEESGKIFSLAQAIIRGGTPVCLAEIPVLWNFITKCNFVKWYLTWVYTAYCFNSLVKWYLTCLFFEYKQRLCGEGRI